MPLTNAPSVSSTPSPDGMDLETDKRQRNNAASARFRAKKKLRDQVLARTAEESVARLEMLERRCREQEMEIKWLRSLTATQLEKGGRYTSLRELYAENGVAWVDDLVASDDSAAVTFASRHALAPVPVAPVPELQPIVAPVDSEVSVAETLKRQLVAAQPRSAKKQRLL